MVVEHLTLGILAARERWNGTRILANSLDASFSTGTVRIRGATRDAESCRPADVARGTGAVILAHDSAPSSVADLVERAKAVFVALLGAEAALASKPTRTRNLRVARA